MWIPLVPPGYVGVDPLNDNELILISVKPETSIEMNILRGFFVFANYGVAFRSYRLVTVSAFVVHRVSPNCERAYCFGRCCKL